jgi:hypothetical protein
MMNVDGLRSFVMDGEGRLGRRFIHSGTAGRAYNESLEWPPNISQDTKLYYIYMHLNLSEMGAVPT